MGGSMVSTAGPRAGSFTAVRAAAVAARRANGNSRRLAEFVPGHADIPVCLLRAPCYLEIMIPARDEAMRLPHTLMQTVQYLEAQPYSSSVVVIDNGSADRTVDLVTRIRSERVAIDVIGCAELGKGFAVRRGIVTSQARFIGYMDADLATPIETLDLVVPLLESGCQAVVGSRHIRGAIRAERQSVHRLLGGMFFRAMARQVLPGIADTQCGFKFFDGSLVRAFAHELRVAGYAFDVELLGRIIEHGMPVKEIPVVWSDRDGSTFRALRDGTRSAIDVLHLARRRALCPHSVSSPDAGF
jgi:glycosyltransferase involved in cell wall biosynthesis